jgi:protein-S-isoprenylcysteine O-methyltransferase Ste14
MDSVRYYIALFLVAFTPGVYLYWFSIHPLIGFWRKIGLRPTLALHYTLMIALAVPLVLMRKTILSVDLGAKPVLMLLAALLLALVIYMRKEISKKVATKVLSGFPELAPDQYEPRLLTDGIYARIRHPRYVQLLLAILAYALFTNYLAVYAVFLVGLVWAPLVVRIEERELRDRFGADYERYCESVPRFLPRLRGRNSLRPG